MRLRRAAMEPLERGPRGLLERGQRKATLPPVVDERAESCLRRGRPRSRRCAKVGIRRGGARSKRGAASKPTPSRTGSEWFRRRGGSLHGHLTAVNVHSLGTCVVSFCGGGGRLRSRFWSSRSHSFSSVDGHLPSHGWSSRRKGAARAIGTSDRLCGRIWSVSGVGGSARQVDGRRGRLQRCDRFGRCPEGYRLGGTDYDTLPPRTRNASLSARGASRHQRARRHRSGGRWPHLAD